MPVLAKANLGGPPSLSAPNYPPPKENRNNRKCRLFLFKSLQVFIYIGSRDKLRDVVY